MCVEYSDVRTARQESVTESVTLSIVKYSIFGVKITRDDAVLWGASPAGT